MLNYCRWVCDDCPTERIKIDAGAEVREYLLNYKNRSNTSNRSCKWCAPIGVWYHESCTIGLRIQLKSEFSAKLCIFSNSSVSSGHNSATHDLSVQAHHRWVSSTPLSTRNTLSIDQEITPIDGYHIASPLKVKLNSLLEKPDPDELWIGLVGFSNFRRAVRVYCLKIQQEAHIQSFSDSSTPGAAKHREQTIATVGTPVL